MTAFQNVLDSFKEETSMLSKHELWIATQVFYGLNSKKLANPMLTNSWSESLHFFFIFFPFFHVFLVCSNCKLELRIKYLQIKGWRKYTWPAWRPVVLMSTPKFYWWLYCDSKRFSCRYWLYERKSHKDTSIIVAFGLAAHVQMRLFTVLLRRESVCVCVCVFQMGLWRKAGCCSLLLLMKTKMRTQSMICG